MYKNSRVDHTYCSSELTDIMKTDELTWFHDRSMVLSTGGGRGKLSLKRLSFTHQKKVFPEKKIKSYFKYRSYLMTILTLNRPGFLQIGMAGGGGGRGQILPPPLKFLFGWSN